MIYYNSHAEKLSKKEYAHPVHCYRVSFWCACINCV
jgi:hypothetical protein